MALPKIMALCAFALVLPGAFAVTIDTFSFTQLNYVNQSQTNTFTNVSGTFSGTPDAAGFISLASLTGFSLDGDTVTPTFFSFDVNGGSSSLDVALSDPAAAAAVNCIGAAAAFGGTLTGLNCGAGGANGYLLEIASVPQSLFLTQSLPVVTLVSSVTTSATPEPSTLPLVAVALAAAALWRFRCGRPIRSAAPRWD